MLIPNDGVLRSTQSSVVNRKGLVAVSALLVAGCSGCKADDCCAAVGTPEVLLGTPADAGVIAGVTYPSPCEVDVAFGPVRVGGRVTASVNIYNLGPVDFFDLVFVDAGTDPGFSFTVDTSQPVAEGSLDEVALAFQPIAVGAASSWLTIVTDGRNDLCPLGVYDRSTLKIQVMGIGGPGDGGSP